MAHLGHFLDRFVPDRASQVGFELLDRGKTQHSLVLVMALCTLGLQAHVGQETLREGGKRSATDCKGVSGAARPDKQKTPEKSGSSASRTRFSPQAAVGFEPTNNGFAIRPLSPLGYAADTGGDG